MDLRLAFVNPTPLSGMIAVHAIETWPFQRYNDVAAQIFASKGSSFAFTFLQQESVQIQ